MRSTTKLWTSPCGMLLTGALLIGSGCNSSKAVRGGAIGAVGGGAAGAVIGNQVGDRGTVWGALIGAAVGGTAGALIGNHMDKQAAELQADLKDANVERVGEGIKITFNSGLLFAVDKSNLQAGAQQNINSLATTLNKYEDTEILIEGHTDDTGTDEYNMRLSRERAESVRAQLIASGVQPGRISTVGYGEGQPKTDNASDAGRAQNRRVEVAIYANKRMKKAAERGELGAAAE